jgi:hypothetical protein
MKWFAVAMIAMRMMSGYRIPNKIQTGRAKEGGEMCILVPKML